MTARLRAVDKVIYRIIRDRRQNEGQHYDLLQRLMEARDEVALDKLTAALMIVVDETMQPEKVSLWIKS